MPLMTPMHRQVLLLAGAQALFQTVSVMVMTVGGLAGAALTSDPRFATAPIATMVLGTAAATVPASLLMARVGRRPGFILGAMLGGLGGVLGAVGIGWGSMALLGTGTFLVGAYQGFAQFYRFAAAEVADAGFRPRAIALVLAGGVVAALVGPELARHGGTWLEPAFTGSFLVLGLLGMLAAGLLLGLRVPDMGVTDGEGPPPRPLRAIIGQPTYLVALFGAASGYGIMLLCMTATPLAMLHHHHGLGDASMVIQMHVLGMFLPSFATGSLIARFGVLRIMTAGVGLLAAHVGLTLTGTAFASFAGALTLLGVGWNFLYIGGTTLLTSTYAAAEKGRAQAANDLIIFTVALGASLAAGALLDQLGWQAMNIAMLPWLGLTLLAILWLAVRERRQRQAGAAQAATSDDDDILGDPVPADGRA
ncbi:MAG TPA: MFS transporter [Azospirillum sp.]